MLVAWPHVTASAGGCHHPSGVTPPSGAPTGRFIPTGRCGAPSSPVSWVPGATATKGSIVSDPATEAAPTDGAVASDGGGGADDRTGGGVGRHERHVEVLATLLLALAALATAWSSYQASLWDGIQSSDYTQASALRTRAAQQRTEANQLRLADLGVFENYIDAAIDGDTELADFYRARFRDEFEPAFEAWSALDPLTDPDAPATPFAMPEYRLADDRAAEDLEARADARFRAGEDANGHSDTYTATTLFFAASLFFAAVSERFSYQRARAALLGLSGVGLVVGAILVVTQPVTSG